MRPDGPALFFAGNVLPDLLHGHLRAPTLNGRSDEAAIGARLHLASDRLFHTDSAFLAGCRSASARLRALRLSRPPRRIFFLAHISFELALDGFFLRTEANLADDLLSKMSACSSEAIAAARDWRSEPSGYTNFVERGFIRGYSNDRGLATALMRTARRVGETLLPETDADLALLSDFFTQLRHEIAGEADTLLSRMEAAWYNRAIPELSGSERDHADDH